MGFVVLGWVSAETRPDLLAEPVYQVITNLPIEQREVVQVAEINPAFAGGLDFCEQYGYAHTDSANCVLVQGTRADESVYAACVVPPNARADLNGLVRRHLHVRRVSLIPREIAIEKNAMEYGSMTALGLPSEWRVLVDERIYQAPQVILGSGRVHAKIRLPGAVLLAISKGDALADLACAIP